MLQSWELYSRGNSLLLIPLLPLLYGEKDCCMPWSSNHKEVGKVHHYISVYILDDMCGTSTLLTCIRTITSLCSDKLLSTLAKNQPLALLIVK